MPYAPNEIKKNGNIIFNVLKIEFLIKMNFELLNEINMLSIKELKVAKIMKIIKAKLSIIFFWINWSFGEKKVIPKRKITDTIVVINAVSVNAVFILSFFLSDFGRKRINPVFKPNKEKEAISPITEMIVVANPTSSARNNLAIIIQNIKPKIDIINVLAIIWMEFLYKESSIIFL